MYAEIVDTLHAIYGILTTHETISRITDKILPYVREWQEHPLSLIQPFVYFNASLCLLKKVIVQSKKAVIRFY